MTRAIKISAIVAMGLCMAASTAAAQKAPAVTSGGEITIGTVVVPEGVSSSKFTEYREVPSGGYLPFVNLWTKGGKFDLNLRGYNVQAKDQRFNGDLSAYGFGLKFDWNQIPHDVGNDAHLSFANTAPGIWSMSSTLRQALQTAVDTRLPTSARTYDWYVPLLAPTFAATNNIDISSIRRSGNVALSFGKHLPFDLTLTYKNELKTGYRGLGSVNFRERVSPSVEVLNPLDEITHDFGFRAAKSFAKGSVYAGFTRSLYDNRIESMMIDFPFQAADMPYTAAAGAIPAIGGLSRERFVMAPDNQANTTNAGFTLKFAKNTRISGGLALQTRTQDAAFFPYTANTALNTTAGVGAYTTAALQQKSYGGKVETTMYNLSFFSRPLDNLTLRAQVRQYDLTDKSKKYVITGDVSGSNSVWSTITATASDPYGHATANVYDTKSMRYSASATYDYKALTVEGQIRGGKLERTSREAEKGTENGMGLTALYHYNDWLGFRGTYDVSKRTAEGETIYGYQMDEAPLTNTRTGVDIELSPMAGLDFSVGYYRRNVEYTDRPNRTIVVSGVPLAGFTPFANTPSGLLDSKYDSYTGQVDWTPNDRLELGAYMTYEKDAQTNQWSTTSGTTVAAGTLNNLLNYLGTDKTNTYGANVVFHVMPEKAKLTLSGMHQKTDGLMDITAREAGSFYTPGRTTLIPAGQGGAADITDWDDTEMTSVTAQMDYTLTKSWTFTCGYMYERYDFLDAFNATKSLMPAAVNIFTKPNDGQYNASMIFARMNVRF